MHHTPQKVSFPIGCRILPVSLQRNQQTLGNVTREIPSPVCTEGSPKGVTSRTGASGFWSPAFCSWATFFSEFHAPTARGTRGGYTPMTEIPRDTSVCLGARNAKASDLPRRHVSRLKCSKEVSYYFIYYTHAVTFTSRRYSRIRVFRCWGAPILFTCRHVSSTRTALH